MRMSEQGRKLLIQREGTRLEAYRDSVGVWTIGVGHTAAAGAPVPKASLKITAAECDQILSRDLRQYEQAVEKALKVPVAQNEFDALVSVCFNVGTGFAGSTAIKLLNTGDRKGAAEAILWWNKPPEIRGRRKGEYTQFLTPYKGAIPPPPDIEPIPPQPSEPSWLEALMKAALAAFRRR